MQLLKYLSLLYFQFDIDLTLIIISGRFLLLKIFNYRDDKNLSI